MSKNLNQILNILTLGFALKEKRRTLSSQREGFLEKKNKRNKSNKPPASSPSSCLDFTHWGWGKQLSI